MKVRETNCVRLTNRLKLSYDQHHLYKTTTSNSNFEKRKELSTNYES